MYAGRNVGPQRGSRKEIHVEGVQFEMAGIVRIYVYLYYEMLEPNFLQVPSTSSIRQMMGMRDKKVIVRWAWGSGST